MSHVGDQTPCARPECGHPWAAHAYDDPTTVCREIVDGDDPAKRYDPYLNPGHRWCGCRQFKEGRCQSAPAVSTNNHATPS